MMATPCPEWCQVDRPHERHEYVMTQFHAETIGDRQRRPVVVQFGVQGVHEPQPALTLILPDATQISVTFPFEPLMEWVTAAELAVWRHRNVEG